MNKFLNLLPLTFHEITHTIPQRHGCAAANGRGRITTACTPTAKSEVLLTQGLQNRLPATKNHTHNVGSHR